MDHACTVVTLVAVGLALMATSVTRLEADDPSCTFASYIMLAVSGQRLVQRESMKASTTSRPRREDKDTGCPNWSTRLKSGAISPLMGKPRIALFPTCTGVAAGGICCTIRREIQTDPAISTSSEVAINAARASFRTPSGCRIVCSFHQVYMFALYGETFSSGTMLTVAVDGAV